MEAESLIGFGLIVLAVSMLASLVFTGALVLFSQRLRTAAPRLERRAATLALALPPLLGFGVSATLATSGLLTYFAGQDHCLDHAHHLHLCLIHGEQWAFEPWAVATVTFFGTFMLVRLVQTIWRHSSAQRAARRLLLVGQPIPHLEQTFIVPSEERFAFTTGVFSSTIIISRAAWDTLDASQRQAVLAHEQAHVQNGDLWKRTALGWLACFGIPVLTQKALKLWELASERESDREAVRRVNKPSIVASAILLLTSAKKNNQVPAAAVFAAACHVSDRVHSLFAQPDSGNPAAKRILLFFMLGIGAMAVKVAIFAESLHHLLETILG